MAIPSTGSISMSDIQTEFGGSNPISLSEYYAGGGQTPAGTTGNNGTVPSSGAIDMGDFRGSTNAVYMDADGGTETTTITEVDTETVLACPLPSSSTIVSGSLVVC